MGEILAKKIITLLGLPSYFAMYNKDSQKDWLAAAITAALGAGIVTSFAVSQGQHPILALAITGLATVVALLLY